MTRKRKTHNQPTIRDIAKEADVSPTTVSLALEGKPTSRVSKTTRQKITRIAKRLNYRPNYMARSLATTRSHFIGLIVPTLANPMYAEIDQDIIDRGNETGYGVLVRSVSGAESPNSPDG